MSIRCNKCRRPVVTPFRRRSYTYCSQQCKDASAKHTRRGLAGDDAVITPELTEAIKKRKAELDSTLAAFIASRRCEDTPEAERAMRERLGLGEA